MARLDWLGRALVARDAAAFCVAGVALGDIHVRSAWQAWHKLTSTVVLRGRRGTDGTGWRAWCIKFILRSPACFRLKLQECDQVSMLNEKKSAGMPHASVYIDLLSCLVPFCVRAMTISLGSCTIHTHIHTYIT